MWGHFPPTWQCSCQNVHNVHRIMHTFKKRKKKYFAVCWWWNCQLCFLTFPPSSSHLAPQIKPPAQFDLWPSGCSIFLFFLSLLLHNLMFFPPCLLLPLHEQDLLSSLLSSLSLISAQYEHHQVLMVLTRSCNLQSQLHVFLLFFTFLHTEPGNNLQTTEKVWKLTLPHDAITQNMSDRVHSVFAAQVI